MSIPITFERTRRLPLPHNAGQPETLQQLSWRLANNNDRKRVILEWERPDPHADNSAERMAFRLQVACPLCLAERKYVVATRYFLDTRAAKDEAGMVDQVEQFALFETGKECPHVNSHQVFDVSNTAAWPEYHEWRKRDGWHRHAIDEMAEQP